MNRSWGAYTTTATSPGSTAPAWWRCSRWARSAQHGPHLPLATDLMLLEGVIAATIPLLPDAVPAAFIAAAAGGTLERACTLSGTLSLSAETLLRVLVEM